ncbi:endonuclease domain-containing protein [Agrobacterium sp. DE0009]|uniref:endonuclease domain-containing protein n=1 Tax=Agrobacterium sp. DE0009 TaxID=2587505 RepID=UPI0011A523E7|nr:endonuclease domain-containing protein [Agrobacterium sp. DE0009]
MPHADVDPVHRKYAKQTRKVMTDAELKLWNAIRAHRLEGLSFRRQMPIAGFIVDFACSDHRLVVEVDGSQHTSDAALRYDQERTARLEKDGWNIFRFWNHEVLTDLDNVCLHIIRTIREDRI